MFSFIIWVCLINESELVDDNTIAMGESFRHGMPALQRYKMLADAAQSLAQSTPHTVFATDERHLSLTDAEAGFNTSNTTMRLGLELKFGEWLVDIFFNVAFNSSNTSSVNMCQDRGARCLPEEMRIQLKDTNSRLMHLLHNGRFARLLARGEGVGEGAQPFLFERRQRPTARYFAAPCIFLQFEYFDLPMSRSIFVWSLKCMQTSSIQKLRHPITECIGQG